jgi:hypothetical protein
MRQMIVDWLHADQRARMYNEKSTRFLGLPYDFHCVVDNPPSYNVRGNETRICTRTITDDEHFPLVNVGRKFKLMEMSR